MSRSGSLAKRDPEATEVMSLVDSSWGRIMASLPDNFTPAKMVQVMSIIAYKTPKLAQCVPESIVTSIVTAGALGLDLTPALGECYLSPRWNKKIGALECNCQPGYHGLKKLAVQTGEIASIDPRLVRSGEKFRVVYDPDLTIYHEPEFDDKAPITHVYCVTKLLNGERKIEVMTADQIDSVRIRSDSADSGPWVTDWSEMAKKTVFKRQAKYLPRSVKLAEAIDLDNREYEASEAVPAHHAARLGNDTGHGRTGAYAPPEQVASYREWLGDYVARVNAAWVQRFNDHWEPGKNAPNGAEQLTSTWQLSGHICKWGRDCGLIVAPDEPRTRQYDPLAAIAWGRDARALKEEAKRYVGSLKSVKWDKLFPPDPEAADEDQGDPDDVEYPQEPECVRAMTGEVKPAAGTLFPEPTKGKGYPGD